MAASTVVEAGVKDIVMIGAEGVAVTRVLVEVAGVETVVVAVVETVVVAVVEEEVAEAAHVGQISLV